MSEEKCGCEYLNTGASVFRKYTLSVRVEEAIKIIPPLFHERKDFVKIMEIAATLPPEAEMRGILKNNEEGFGLDVTEIKATHAKKLYQTLRAIQGSFSSVMRDSPYAQNIDTIKFLPIFADKSEEGMEFWRKDLLDHLMSTDGLRSLETWIKRANGIKALIKAFDLSEARVKKILEDLINKEKGSYTVDCLSAAQAMGVKINPQVFQNIADELIKSANKQEGSSRKNYVDAACKVYKILSADYGFKDRDILWKTFGNESCDDNGRKTLRAASTILNFKYISRGIWDRVL